MKDEVRVPGKGIDPAGTDVVGPATDLLIQTELLPEPGDQNKSTVGRTPYSLQVINAGALAVSKWWTGAIAALGGLAIVSGAVTNFWEGEDDPVQVALVVGVSVMVASFAIAIAVIVRGDVAARAQASAAQYEARGIVTQAYLELLRAGGSASTGKGVSSDSVIRIHPSQDGLIIEGGSGMRGKVAVKGVRQLENGLVELKLAGE